MSHRIPNAGLEAQGIETRATLHWNLVTARLIEAAVARGEGKLSADGPLVVETGRIPAARRRTSSSSATRRRKTRSGGARPTRRCRPSISRRSRPISSMRCAARNISSSRICSGAPSRSTAFRVRVVNELAWHNSFIRTMLVRPEESEMRDFEAEYTIIDLPSFQADPARHGCRSETVIAVNFSEKLILIGGTRYAGEMKKSVFSLLNYLLPPTGVMPMHCSANIGPAGDTAVFFGLSGTGKTTLSADASRTLIGDDEHGWSDTAVFNFEGGCYAKMIRLSADAEPEIFATTKRFGTILENVVMDQVTRQLDLDDASLAENSRGAYPIDFIPNASEENMGPVPRNIVMLTADAYGVLPPIAKLTPDQAMYHFLSGYTARVAGTEIGVTEPDATFSTCFGAPFMARHPSVYGNLLKERIAKGGVDCWLVNTGWTGGKYGVGSRMPIKATRALLNAALDGSLNDAEFRTDANFGFEVPVSVAGVDGNILDPRETWADKEAYDATAARLVDLFVENFAQFADHVDEGVRQAAPRTTETA